jgi:hypothetical protein
MVFKSLGLTLLIVTSLLIVSGVAGIWLGASGIIINNAIVHFGATTITEIDVGITLLSIGLAALTAFLILYFYARPLLWVFTT